jgi:adenylosuccinate synthase
MTRLILILSGPIAAGKTTLCDELVANFGFTEFKTSELLKNLSKGQIKYEREALQEFGESLDKKTKGTWLKDSLMKLIEQLPPDSIVVVDSGRIKEQIEIIHNSFHPPVIHIHLTASLEILAKRFKNREKKDFKEALTYEDVQKNSIEKDIEKLGEIADIVIDTSICSNKDVTVRVISFLKQYLNKN